MILRLFVVAIMVAAATAMESETGVKIGYKNSGDVESGESGESGETGQIDQAVSDIPMPDPLTSDTFDKVTADKLTFVEFYSPYCSHCKQLAPTWERTYKEYFTELQLLNVEMRQVNCIESGDLCEREDIFAYPNLRIYAPQHDKSGELLGTLKFVSTFPRSLVRTPENFKKFVRNSVAEYDAGSIDVPSVSRDIDVDELLKLFAGEAQQPEFVIFHPGTSDQWKVTEDTGRSAFSNKCYDCLYHKQVWDKLSTQIQTTVGTHHFGCGLNPELCDKIGFRSLTNSKSIPRFLMFLPKSTGIIKFEYKGPISLEDMKAYAVKLAENYQYETVSPKTLSEIMDFRKLLPLEPLNSYYPLANKVSLLFYYDPNSISEEDKAILPYLLKFATESPFNINIYTGKSNKYEGALNAQADGLLNLLAYDETPKKPFNKAMYLATTLTSKPTVFVIKDNTLFTPVYQNFAPEDLRDETKLMDFLYNNQFPLYQELTPRLVSTYFNKKVNSHNQKVVITFIDSNNARVTDESLYNMSLIAHDYHYTKQEYYFGQIVEQRQAKVDRAEKLKEQNADSVSIIKEMRREVPHLFNENQVLFTFIDVATNPNLPELHGWNIDSKLYKPGDTIVVNKDNKHYYDESIDGKPLQNDPFMLKPVLKYLLDPQLINAKLTPKLVGSPYGTSLRFMDNIHERGFWGYLLVMIVIYAVITLVSRTRKPSEGLGIIGNFSKKD